MCWQSNHQKMFYIFNMQYFSCNISFTCIHFFKMGLTTSESSSSSSQCLSAARGSPTTLSSPITPCCKQGQGVLMFDDIYIMSEEHLFSHIHTYDVLLSSHKYGCLSLNLLLGNTIQGIPPFHKIRGVIEVSSLSLWSATISAPHARSDTCSHTGYSHRYHECYLTAYQRAISSVWRGIFSAAELFEVDSSGHIYVLRRKKKWNGFSKSFEDK